MLIFMIISTYFDVFDPSFLPEVLHLSHSFQPSVLYLKLSLFLYKFPLSWVTDWFQAEENTDHFTFISQCQSPPHLQKNYHL